MKQINIGILGAGRIAGKMAQTVGAMDSVNGYAIAARELSRAQAFSQEYGITKAYGSYEELLSDHGVDLVYIATPNSLHKEQMLQCLQAGKHVLCEKPFTLDAAQAKEVLAQAQGKGLLVAEAMWTRYLPLAETLGQLGQGRLGQITGVTANLGYPVYYKERVQDPALGGGALLDLGVYLLNFASLVMGDNITQLDATAVFSDTGVDTQTAVNLVYPQGAMASLYCTAMATTNRMGMICGKQGYALVDNVNHMQCIQVFDQEYHLLEKTEKKSEINGFEYQVQACVDAINNDQLECPQMPHSKIIAMMEWMDQVRSVWAEE